MEAHGERPNGRPAIARRSCDHCRTRKIACDRGSPCSNCVSARLDCTHSAIVSNTDTAKKRFMISAQYEHKVDDIAKSIDGIKHLLQGLSVTPSENHHDIPSYKSPEQADSGRLLIGKVEEEPVYISRSQPIYDHSAHIICFVKDIVEAGVSGDTGSGSDEVIASLRTLVQTVEGPTVVRPLTCPDKEAGLCQADVSMPPLKAVVAVLRWAKEHEEYFRLDWISHILPLEMFAEICRKVYFAVEDYTEIDYILANAYLSYIFAEHVVVTGLLEHRQHSLLCRKNLYGTVTRLPLLIPASMEVIATLTIAAFYAIEHSKATMAWTYISTAAQQCLTLGYHRLRKATDQPLQNAHANLFWTVHKLEKGLSLRLGRASTIRDSEITLPPSPNEPRSRRVARIQGQVYDHLYSPAGLARPDCDRGLVAEALTRDLQELISEIHLDLLDNASQPSNRASDPMRTIYLQSDLCCYSSLLVSVLRAIPNKHGFPDSVSDDCIAVAHETMDLHEQCMTSIRSCKNDPFMVARYINWSIMHVPFVPFQILFSHAVQSLDVDELARLERFAASLQPTAGSEEPVSAAAGLYDLLCKAARLYIEQRLPSLTVDGDAVEQQQQDRFDEFDFADYIVDGGMGIDDIQPAELGDWYDGNQQIMSLLDDDVML